MSFAGTYRGVRFRSLLELSFIRKMEREGLLLNEGIFYEALNVPYVSAGRHHRYVVDFYCPSRQEAWEVKPARRRAGRRNSDKAAAAVLYLARMGIRYSVLDERDIGHVLTVEQAAAIEGVQLAGRKSMRAMQKSAAKRLIAEGRRRAKRKLKKAEREAIEWMGRNPPS